MVLAAHRPCLRCTAVASTAVVACMQLAAHPSEDRHSPPDTPEDMRQDTDSQDTQLDSRDSSHSLVDTNIREDTDRAAQAAVGASVVVEAVVVVGAEQAQAAERALVGDLVQEPMPVVAAPSVRVEEDLSFPRSKTRKTQVHCRDAEADSRVIRESKMRQA